MSVSIVVEYTDYSGKLDTHEVLNERLDDKIISYDELLFPDLGKLKFIQDEFTNTVELPRLGQTVATVFGPVKHGHQWSLFSKNKTAKFQSYARVSKFRDSYDRRMIYYAITIFPAKYLAKQAGYKLSKNIIVTIPRDLWPQISETLKNNNFKIE